jgi:hypothetical protein
MNYIQQFEYTHEQTQDFNKLVRHLYKWAKVVGKNNMEHNLHSSLHFDVLSEEALEEDTDDSKTSRSFGGKWDDEMDEDNDLISDDDTEWNLFKTRADLLLLAPTPQGELETHHYDKAKAGKCLNRFDKMTKKLLKEYGTIETVIIMMEAVSYAKTLKSLKMVD